jgi:hypothetical protein
MWCASDREKKGKSKLKPGESTVATESGNGCCASSRPIVKKNDYEKEKSHEFNKDVNDRRRKMLDAAKRNMDNLAEFEETFSFRNSPARIKLKKSAVEKTKGHNF